MPADITPWQPGHLVTSTVNALGTGKITALHGSTVELTYFESAAIQHQETVPLDSLRPVTLYPETRCYALVGGHWRAGRIFERRYAGEEEYAVRYPNGHDAYVHERDLYVRWVHPIRKPMELLAFRISESPVFHCARTPMVEALIQLRAASRGMTGLLSSGIELHPHQVDVVQRVLQDTSQRYLLADEVGLGKTIEAGAILRQFLLDEPEQHAVVLAPTALLTQWQEELHHKFYTDDFPGRVQLSDVAHAAQLKGDIGLVIVDEAHHAAALQQSASADDQRLYAQLAHLAHTSKRLLLLSATPVLRNEQAFLAMLHLLEPQVYRLEEVDAFTQRVLHRQAIGRFLYGFTEDTPGFLLESQLIKAKSLFTDDARLHTLLSAVEALVDEGSDEELNAAVRAVRVHIGETYRLHRRMLRNRRIKGVEHLVRGRTAPMTVPDTDPRRPRVLELLHAWREAAALAYDQLDQPPSSDILQMYATLFELSGTWLPLLKHVVDLRLGHHTDQLAEFSPEVTNVLRSDWTFPEEQVILQALSDALTESVRDHDRIECLLEWVAAHARPTHFGGAPKVVVFTSYPGVCHEIARRATEKYGKDLVAMHSERMTPAAQDTAVKRFLGTPTCSLLVCDRSAEEGRNFQEADWLVHFDLPLSPNRIEQRIGRADRFSRRHEVQSMVITDVDTLESPHQEWLACLMDGFAIFHQSVASLQFFIEDKMPVVLQTLFNGDDLMLTSGNNIPAEIKAEIDKILEQDILDSLEAVVDDRSDFHDDLMEAEAGNFEAAARHWIEKTLQFQRLEESKRAFRYLASDRPPRTLLPWDSLMKQFGPSLRQRSTYSRRAAVQEAPTHLLRPGQPFVDGIAQWLRWDDRGQAYAHWRHHPKFGDRDPVWAFRFDFVVEADVEPAVQALPEGKRSLQRPALRRRLDGYLPPATTTLWLDATLQHITDPITRHLLSLPYRNDPPNVNSTSDSMYLDYHLNAGRAWVWDQLMTPGAWAALCRDAQDAAHAAVREQLHSDARRLRAEERTRRRLEMNVELLRLRAARDPQSVLDLQTEEHLAAQLLAGVLHPSIRLDAVGFVLLSGEAPPAADGLSP